jgi:hypothetical protein
MSQLSQKIKAELNRLVAKSPNMLLMPEDIVAAARSPKNPLHGCFEWDDRKAAAKYRLYQARQLIGAYLSVEKTESGEPVEVRHFISLTTDRINGGGYRALPDILDDESLRNQLLADAVAELERIQVKYSQLKQLRPVFEALDEVRTTRRRMPKKSQREVRAN